MSICSGAVDGSLMSKNSLVLIIRYLEDFKVGSPGGFSVGRCGRGAMETDALLEYQIKSGKSLFMNESVSEVKEEAEVRKAERSH